MMRRPFAFLPAAAFALALAAQPAPEPRDESRAVFNEIDQSVAELSRITGLKLHRKIAYDLIDRARVNEFLRKRIKEDVRPEEVRAEELTLKKFGLVPPEFNLEKTTVDLLTEQAAAFYDFHTKKLYISDWTPSAARAATLVHELAHALADQNFNLGRYLKRAGKSDDAALARMAVMEGQASWLMSEYLAQKSGQSLATSPALAEMMSRASDFGGDDYPVFDGAPLYIRETLVFPYTKGMRFQQTLVEKNGKQAFAEVFRHPPVSTQQILHPEAYFSRRVPSEPELPALTSTHGYKELVQGYFGELDHVILVRQFAGQAEADELCPHWRGGRYQLLERRTPERVVLAYASRWDSPDSARLFFRFYRDTLRKKWKNVEVLRETENSVAGVGDDGYFDLRLEGVDVRSLEGLESPGQAK
ncbi:MAG: ImmA/IrrE family metallo-endopeptidase [Acidobacteria bacterium]|nr:ImmA/IrrE family metallo-endopeptidase [Acidobacteriota bacterium]